MLTDSIAPLNNRSRTMTIGTPINIGDNNIEWTFRVDPKDPVFDGHFPDAPILPGVYTLDLISQGVEAFVAHREHRSVALQKVKSIRYLAPLTGGDLISIRASVSCAECGEVKVDAKVVMNGENVVTTKLMFDTDSSIASAR